MTGNDKVITQYIVDAFTDKVFTGNPAAVCVMDSWPEEEWMTHVAAENNLSETAFIVPEKDGRHLRWFTPGGEVELCGHATLASAFVILNYYDKGSERVEFSTLSGRLTVLRRNGMYEMDLPAYGMREITVTDDMERAFGARPVRALLGPDLVCVFENENIVRSLEPDQEALKQLEGRIQNATARGRDADCVSRSFAPKLSIAEDPVCGSAHCQIAAYWAEVLGKSEIRACQASKRGGTLYCRLTDEGRMKISGEAVLFAVSKLVI